MRAIARASARLALAALLLFAVACGSDEDSNSSAGTRDGRLIAAADVPGMRLHDLSPLLGPDGAADIASQDIFKDPFDQVVSKLSAAGFKRGIAEQFLGAGTGARAIAMEFGSEAQAREMLDYMNEQLFMPCPDEPQCSERKQLEVSGIPGAKGQQLKRFKESHEGAESTEYKVLFPIGAVVYAVAAGDASFHDPVQISRTDALEIFRAVYDRIRGLQPDRLFPTGTPEPAPSCPPGSGPCPRASGTS